MSLRLLLKKFYLKIHPKYIEVDIPSNSITLRRVKNFSEMPRSVLSCYYELDTGDAGILYYYYDFCEFKPSKTFLFHKSINKIYIRRDWENHICDSTNHSDSPALRVTIHKEDYLLFKLQMN